MKERGKHTHIHTHTHTPAGIHLYSRWEVVRSSQSDLRWSRLEMRMVGINTSGQSA